MVINCYSSAANFTTKQLLARNDFNEKGGGAVKEKTQDPEIRDPVWHVSRRRFLGLRRRFSGSHIQFSGYHRLFKKPPKSLWHTFKILRERTESKISQTIFRISQAIFRLKFQDPSLPRIFPSLGGGALNFPITTWRRNRRVRVHPIGQAGKLSSWV